MSATQDIRSAVRHRRESRTDLLRRVAYMEKAHAAKVARLNAENDSLVCALRKAATEVDAKGRALNAEVVISVGRLQKIGELEGEIKFQAGKVVRAEADVRRLVASLKNTQKALRYAQPRITVVNAAMDRPYVAGVPIPYPVPVGRSTANDHTQELPILDRPAPVPAAAVIDAPPSMADRFAAGSTVITLAGGPRRAAT
jgi:hypothetical protein